MSRSDEDLYSIGTASSMTGVNPATLRAWERRYGLVEPSRTAKGHRLYSDADIARIQRIVSLLDHGVAPSRIGSVLEAEEPGTSAPDEPGWEPLLHKMLGAVRRFDEPALDGVYREALAAWPLDAVTENLTVPMLRKLGERWESGEGLVAEEHFFRDYVRNAIGSRLFHRARPPSGHTLVTACMPGEEHDIGLLLFNLTAEQAGFRIVTLGANTPLEDLPHVAAVTRARALVLAAGYAPIDAEAQSELEHLVRRTSLPVFVGGRRSEKDGESISDAGAMPLGARITAAVKVLTRELGERP